MLHAKSISASCASGTGSRRTSPDSWVKRTHCYIPQLNTQEGLESGVTTSSSSFCIRRCVISSLFRALKHRERTKDVVERTMANQCAIHQQVLEKQSRPRLHAPRAAFKVVWSGTRIAVVSSVYLPTNTWPIVPVGPCLRQIRGMDRFAGVQF